MRSAWARCATSLRSSEVAVAGVCATVCAVVGLFSVVCAAHLAVVACAPACIRGLWLAAAACAARCIDGVACLGGVQAYRCTGLGFVLLQHVGTVVQPRACGFPCGYGGFVQGVVMCGAWGARGLVMCAHPGCAAGTTAIAKCGRPATKCRCAAGVTRRGGRRGVWLSVWNEHGGGRRRVPTAGLRIWLRCHIALRRLWRSRCVHCCRGARRDAKSAVCWWRAGHKRVCLG